MFLPDLIEVKKTNTRFCKICNKTVTRTGNIKSHNLLLKAGKKSKSEIIKKTEEKKSYLQSQLQILQCGQ